MAIEKSKQDYLLKALEEEYQPFKAPSPAKYKKSRGEKRDFGEIYPGAKCVVRVTDGNYRRNSDVLGYLKCMILDYQVVNGRWDSRCIVVAKTLDCSNEKLTDLVNRFISATAAGSWWYSQAYVLTGFDTSIHKWLGNENS